MVPEHAPTADPSPPPAWDGLKRVCVNAGGSHVETTLHTLGSFGPCYLTLQPPSDEAIFLDFPAEAFNVMHRALVVAKFDLDEALRVCREGLRAQGAVLRCLVRFLNLAWVLGADFPAPVGERRCLDISGPSLVWSLLGPPQTKPLRRIVPEAPARQLEPGVLAWLANQGKLPCRFETYEEHPQRAYDSAVPGVVYCAIEADEWWVEAGNRPGGRRRRAVEAFSHAMMQIPLGWPVYSSQTARFVFDVGKGSSLALEGFAISLHFGGRALLRECEVRLELSVEASPDLATEQQLPDWRQAPPLVVTERLQPPSGRSFDPSSPGPRLGTPPPRDRSTSPGRSEGWHRRSDQDKNSQLECGPQHIIVVKAPEDARRLHMGRQFALLVEAPLEAGQAIVFRQFELYGSLVEIPDCLHDASQARESYAFDAVSLGHSRVGSSALAARE